MTGKLNGKTGAITGGASGIGLACARAMISEGADVILVDRDETQLTRAIDDLGPKAHSVTLDLLDSVAVSSVLPRLLECTGRLDIFHANAGAYVGGPALDGDPDQWDRVPKTSIPMQHFGRFMRFCRILLRRSPAMSCSPLLWRELSRWYGNRSTLHRSLQCRPLCTPPAVS